MINSQRRGEMNIPYPGLTFFRFDQDHTVRRLSPIQREAEAPFKTLKLSISSGFRLEIPSPASRLPASAVPPIVVKACSLLMLKIGTPSITYKGWLFPDAERLPRITPGRATQTGGSPVNLESSHLSGKRTHKIKILGPYQFPTCD